MDQVKNFHIFVEGRVQGVGFRKFAHTKALARGLRGWVRNRLDGRVEIQVSGQAQELELFLEELRTGPAFSKVRSVTANTIETEQTQIFEIQRDQELK